MSRGTILPTVLLGFVLAGLSPLLSAQADSTLSQIGISPSMYQISLDEPARTHAYRLHNLGGRDTRVRVRVAQWTTDENNEPVFLPPDETSLDQWIIINPVEIDLPVNDSRVVRFSVRPAVQLPPGEHRAMVIFEEEPPQRAELGTTGTIALGARFRINSAIYATTGLIVRNGAITQMALSQDGLQTTIESTGNAHVRPDARARIRSLDTPGIDFEVELAKRPVLQGTTRTLSTPLPAGQALPAGRYEVDISGSLGDGPLDMRQTLTVGTSR